MFLHTSCLFTKSGKFLFFSYKVNEKSLIMCSDCLEMEKSSNPSLLTGKFVMYYKKTFYLRIESLYV